MGVKSTLLFPFLYLLEKVFEGLSCVLQTLYNLLYLPSDLNPNLCSVYTLSVDWKKHAAFAFKPNSPQCWLLKYNRSEPVEYCQSANVSPYHVDKQSFYFVKTTPGLDMYNVEQFPFHYMAQHDHAVELISVQPSAVRDYLRTANQDHAGTNLLILHNTGRCGSTLAAAMIYKTKQAVVISEPSVLYSVLMHHKHNNIPFTSTETHGVVADTLRLLAPDVAKQYVIKTHSAVTQTLPLLKPALPGIREIFMCRNVRQTAMSFKKIFGSMATEGIWNRMSKVFFEEKYLEIFRKCAHPGFNIDESLVFLILTKIYMFTLEQRARCPESIELFQYEELKTDAASFTKRLLAACGIAESHVDTALGALQEDSQRNSALNREQQAECAMISERAMRVGQDIAGELGLIMDLEGNITTLTSSLI